MLHVGNIGSDAATAEALAKAQNGGHDVEPVGEATIPRWVLTMNLVASGRELDSVASS